MPLKFSMSAKMVQITRAGIEAGRADIDHGDYTEYVGSQGQEKLGAQMINTVNAAAKSVRLHLQRSSKLPLRFLRLKHSLATPGIRPNSSEPPD